MDDTSLKLSLVILFSWLIPQAIQIVGYVVKRKGKNIQLDEESNEI